MKPGSTVADIGAGNGALALEMARLVGERSVVYATELSAERRHEIANRVSRADTPQMRIVEATADATHLPDACCDAVETRDQRPQTRLAIIDFPPGAPWFHGSDHGATAGHVIRAFAQAGLSPTGHVENWRGGTYLLRFERATH